MSAIIKQNNLAYISAPKCACTSIKEILFRLENNCNFNKVRDEKSAICLQINGERRYIHSFYPTIPYSQQPHGLISQLNAFCVVRDPRERIVSCYRNRVLRYGAINSEILEKLNINAPKNPDINEFIAYLDEYSKINEIRHHTLPLWHFLGENPDQYHRIFNFSNLQELPYYLKNFFKKVVKLSHLQASENFQQKTSPQSIKTIESIYEKDYKIFGNFLDA